VQLATGLGEAGDGLVDESEVGGEGGMEGDAKEGDAVEGGGMEQGVMEEGWMEVMVQRKRSVAVGGHLGVNEAGLGLEGGGGGLLL